MTYKWPHIEKKTREVVLAVHASNTYRPAHRGDFEEMFNNMEGAELEDLFGLMLEVMDKRGFHTGRHSEPSRYITGCYKLFAEAGFVKGDLSDRIKRALMYYRILTNFVGSVEEGVTEVRTALNVEEV